MLRLKVEKPRTLDPRGQATLTLTGKIRMTLCGKIKLPHGNPLKSIRVRIVFAKRKISNLRIFVSY